MARRSRWFGAGAGRWVCALAGLAALAACARPSSAEVAACSRLQQLDLGHAEITSAKAVGATRGFSTTRALIGVPFLPQPASCRVKGVIRPSPDSTIGFEVWLPQTDWNGRFQGVGNGGFAGSIDELSLSVALHRGYAAAATDAGHVAKDQDGSWALGHPEKIRDYGYRAIHETAVAAKAVISAFYGRGPRHSYFGSASNGGRQGLLLAQRYPEDYDGILAGAPALNPTDTGPAWAWNQELLSTEAGWIGPRKLKTVAAAAMQSCDRVDGLADGLIDDPRACGFRAASLQCHGADADACLTAPQVAALQRIYDGPAHRGRPWGFAPGGELGWTDWITGSKPGKALEGSFIRDFYRYLVYSDADWDLDRFDLARDGPAMKRVLGPVLDAVAPNLSAFKARGGKLILYHGWNDPALQPQSVIDYFEDVQARMGAAETDGFVRLYMVPGLEHGFGGPGPNAFGQLPAGGLGDPKRDISAALEAWVETGVPPGSIVAGKYGSALKPLIAPGAIKPSRTRPLCPYPQVARWTGKGSIDDAANFRCLASPPPASGGG